MIGNNLARIIRGDQENAMSDHAFDHPKPSTNYYEATKHGLKTPANDNGFTRNQKMRNLVLYVVLAVAALAFLAWY